MLWNYAVNKTEVATPCIPPHTHTHTHTHHTRTHSLTLKEGSRRCCCCARFFGGAALPKPTSFALLSKTRHHIDSECRTARVGELYSDAASARPAVPTANRARFGFLVLGYSGSEGRFFCEDSGDGISGEQKKSIFTHARTHTQNTHAHTHTHTKHTHTRTHTSA